LGIDRKGNRKRKMSEGKVERRGKMRERERGER
jgi:hypothetical protein